MTKAERAAIIDEFGELQRRVDEFRPVAERCTALARTIASWYADEPAGESFVEEGRYYSVQISPRTIKRTVVNMPKLYALLGKAKFLELATVTLAAIDKHVAAPLHAKIIRAEMTGERRVKAVAKATATDARAA